MEERGGGLEGLQCTQGVGGTGWAKSEGESGRRGGLLGSVDCRLLQRLHHKTKLDFSKVLVVSQNCITDFVLAWHISLDLDLSQENAPA